MNVNNARRSFPRFTLTNWVPLTFLRFEGEWVRGRYVVSEEPTPLTVRANVQPLKYTELMMMPEADRTKEWIKVFHSYDEENHIRTAKEGLGGWEADIIVWEGKHYKAMRERHYVMGVLDHVSILAAREPISAGYVEQS